MATAPPPVRFARRSTRGFLYGLSKPRLATTATAFAVFTGSLVAAGTDGALASAPVWLVLLTVAFVPVKGRTVIEWAPITGNWWWRKLSGQHRFRARPLRPRPAGSLALPGDAARLRVLVDEVSGAALVHDPHRGTLTAVLQVSHGAFVLVDPVAQAGRVDGWGKVLGGLASHDRGISRVQVLERALPDAGVDVATWWRWSRVDDGSVDGVGLQGSPHRGRAGIGTTRNHDRHHDKPGRGRQLDPGARRRARRSRCGHAAADGVV